MAGAIQRGAALRIERIPNTTRDSLHEFINRNVKDEAKAIYTDEWKAYLGIADEDTRHETVNHSEEEWVVGDVHTNGIEGRLVFVQAFDYRFVSQNEREAHGSLSARVRMAIQ